MMQMLESLQSRQAPTMMTSTATVSPPTRRCRRHLVRPTMAFWSSATVMSAAFRWSTVAAVLAASCGVVSVVSPCYVYPAGARDPCADRRCSYGARCVPSLDGLTARCQCPARCDDYGDSVGAGPLCSDDGLDFANECEMMRTACRDLRDVVRKYDGKCGEYSLIDRKPQEYRLNELALSDNSRGDATTTTR